MATDLTNDGQSGKGEELTGEKWLSPNRIRWWRTSLGLTQVQLAYSSDLDPQSISRIERGEITPRDETTDRIRTALAAHGPAPWDAS